MSGFTKASQRRETVGKAYVNTANVAKYHSKIELEEKTESHEGGASIAKSAYEVLIDFALANFNEDSFYEAASSSETAMHEAVKELCRTKEGALFVMKTAVYARTISNMRTAPTMILGTLDYYIRNWDHKTVMYDAVTMFLTRVDDSINLVAYIKLRFNKHASKHVRKAIADYIDRTPENILAKYRLESRDWKLADIIKLVRPQGRKDLYKRIIEGDLKVTDTWESRLSSGEDKNKVFSEMILEKKIGYMALLRNLNNIEKISAEAFEAAMEILSDPENISKSKQLPFRFFTAYKATSQFSNKIRKERVDDMLLKAIHQQASQYDVFDEDDQVAILVDTSGSMTGMGMSSKSSMSLAENGIALGIALQGLVKNKKNVHFIIWADEAKDISSRFLDDKKVLANLKYGTVSEVGHGTQLHDAMVYTMKNYPEVNKIIVFSDMQLFPFERKNSYFASYYGNTAHHAADKSLESWVVDGNKQVYMINLMNYHSKADIFEKKETYKGNVINITGWSESIFRTMQNNSQYSIAAMIAEIEEIPLVWR